MSLENIKQVCNFIEKDNPTQMFSSEVCKIDKNTFFCRIPPVAASENFSASDISAFFYKFSFVLSIKTLSTSEKVMRTSAFYSTFITKTIRDFQNWP